MCFTLFLLRFTDRPRRQTRLTFLRMILCLWFSPCAQTWFLGNSVVCFGVGFMNQICCVYCMSSLNNHRSVKYKEGGLDSLSLNSHSWCKCIYLFHFIFLPQKVNDIQGNLQDGSQVVVSVIFENKCDSFLKSMEFNVLDSLNSKLQRPEGSGPHDGLTVPFQLPPG